jgi:hypothetical protein
MSNYKPAFGTAIHASLETWYDGIKDGISPTDPSLKERAVQSFREEWNPYEGADETFLRTMQRGEQIVRLYMNNFKVEDFTVLHTEIGGAFELGPYMIIFKSDMVVQMNSTGDIIVFETKTSAHRGYLTVRPNSQIDTYISGIRAIKGLPVKGALLNQIYFRKGKKSENIIDTTSFVREQTNREDDELDDWRKDTLYWADNIRRSCDNDYFPKNPNSCTAYGGCMFQQLCKVSNPAVRESMKRDGYKVEKWEPWEGARGVATNNKEGEEAKR